MIGGPYFVGSAPAWAASAILGAIGGGLALHEPNFTMSSRRKSTRRTMRARRSRVRWSKLAVVAGAGLALTLVAVAAFFVLAPSDGGPPGPPRAVIVDQLELTAPNPGFAEQARELLEAAGYEVDYVPGAEVTVDYYRELPSKGYEIVLLRAHAAGRELADDDYGDDVSLFTSERVSTNKYLREQRERLVKGVGFSREQMERGELYYGIPSSFVRESMEGEFDGATVVLMGCDVLRAQNMAEAFVDRGAGAVVGWDAPVSASHTDLGTLSMLRYLLVDELPVQEAAAAAMAEVGPDPYFDSVFLSYPPEEG